ncbi:hypothetical protein ARMGADRAFT_1082968 [Armillaria gallica]|uniref:MER3 helicase-like winged helix domain-containing protein n=1 Tax=Armillaria gallica TaxID=47427 RepID=A0A2H3D7I8_ARMGA|nr:hypothetical protein ARMGADRAFT_1082968 [Armillaria gallica]
MDIPQINVGHETMNTVDVSFCLLHDYLLAEIAVKFVKNKQDPMDILTWTYLKLEDEILIVTVMMCILELSQSVLFS